MRLKWKLRLYYGALLVVLLGLVGAIFGVGAAKAMATRQWPDRSGTHSGQTVRRA